MSHARCTDCRVFNHTRFCDRADKHIKDARRVRHCDHFATKRTGAFEDGLRWIYDMREALAAAVVDGQFLVVMVAWASGDPAIIATPHRLYLVLPNRLAVLDADAPFGWAPCYEALLSMVGVQPVAFRWTCPGD